MQADSGVRRRQEEDAEEAAAAKAARKSRKARRRLGRHKPQAKGRDPERDAREKELARIATKCAIVWFPA